MNKYLLQNIAVGGTFDRFHRGHKKLLKFAFAFGYKVSIGLLKKPLSTDKILTGLIQDYDIRRNKLEKHIRGIYKNRQFAIIPINSIYGGADTMKELDGIMVTKETHQNVIKINARRKKNGLPTLRPIRIPMVRAADKHEISSSRIRLGQIDRTGRMYGDFFKKTLILPRSARAKLRQPLGELVFRGDEEKKVAGEIVKTIKKLKPTLVVAVGDVVTKTLIEAGRIPDIQVFDRQVRRKPVPPPPVGISQRALKVANVAGKIEPAFAPSYSQSVANFFKDRKWQQIVVRGEEDLTAIPAILLSPLNSLVLYGQFDIGVVGVSVQEITKKRIVKLLSIFKLFKPAVKVGD